VSYSGGRDDQLWAVSDLVGGNVGDLKGASALRLNYAGVPGLNAGIYFGGGLFNELTAAGSFEDAMKSVGIGMSYDLGMMAFSVEFDLFVGDRGGSNDNVNISTYLGVAFADLIPGFSVNADLALVHLASFVDEGVVSFGVGFEYADGPLTVGLKLRGRDLMDTRKNEGQGLGGEFSFPKVTALSGAHTANDYGGGMIVTVDPYASYEINDNLCVGVDFGFYIGLGDGWTKNLMVIAFQPALYYNFIGIGASGDDPDDPSNGMVFKYTMGYDVDEGDLQAHELFVGFRWKF